ncbi:MAG: UvrD-helicase domain-containing protein [Abditibacteriota bacterium]|nr:UvrD-helicase domain-containing protein [Abditibacteriota bacterium]
MNDISFDKLNERQYEAVTDTEGPVLVLAGAGSGKTRVLTTRIAYIVSKEKAKPYNILAVTFTKKAAGEILGRLVTYLGETAGHIWAGTFHSICVRILREYGQYENIDRRFSIYDDYDQAKLIKDIVERLGYDQKKYVPKYVLPRISRAKEQMVLSEDYISRLGGKDAAQISRIYGEYTKALRKNNAFDFDDLIFQAVRLLENHPEVREHYQNKFRYIHVDEYQDINYSQYRLVSLLAGKWNNLFCVGDDDQSIYGWRGADVSIILRFEEDHPNCRIYKLEQNYRSSGNIVKAADAVIRRLSDRNDKQIWTANEDGQHLMLIEASDGENEAVQVCNAICDSMRRNNASYGDYAILYRANHMSRALEHQLRKNGMRYTIVGSTRFYEREEIKDILAYLKAINNPYDDVSLLRIINKPARSIGDKTVDQLRSLAESKGVSVYESFKYLADSDLFRERQKTTITRFALLIDKFIREASSCPVSQLVRTVYEESGMKAALDLEEPDDAYRKPEAGSKKDNIREFISFADEYTRDYEDPDLTGFLEQISLSADIDSYDDGADAISLMTVHSAKGLEFPYVYIIGLEEGIFPHERSLNDSSQLSEERRLMYVAMTRAQKELTLSRAEFRINNGEARRRDKSSFLEDIPDRFFGIEGGGTDHKKPSLSEVKDKISGRDLPVKKQKSFRAGCKVMHPRFGKGLVINCQGEGEREVATVVFDDNKVGIKKILTHAVHMDKI